MHLVQGNVQLTTGKVQLLHPNHQITQKKSQRGARATYLPDDFELTPERRAVAEAHGVPAAATFERFCDYWRAASGQRARKRDWVATWRNWCRTEADRSRGNRSSDGETDPYFRDLAEGLARADH